MNTKPIGIFDSGIGGLKVLQQLESILPKENFIYLADNLNFPYGEKDKEEIIEISKKNTAYLIKQNVKLIIIACGTSTSQSLDILKKNFDIPIIGIIEPTVDYVKTKRISKIGIMATTGTIRSEAWELDLKNKIPNIEIYSQACPALATMAEEGKEKSKEGVQAIQKYVQIFKNNNVKNIILGCTHYPIYDEIIRNEFEYEVNLINTGEMVASYLKKYLEDNNIENNGNEKDETKIFITKEEKDFDIKIKNTYKSIKRLDIAKFY